MQVGRRELLAGGLAAAAPLPFGYDILTVDIQWLEPPRRATRMTRITSRRWLLKAG